MKKLNVAVIESNLDLVDTYRLWLELEGHTVTHFAAGRPFIEQARRGDCDVLLIEWMLPDIGGDKVMQWARTHLGWGMGVIFVTTRAEVSDISYALKLGADDYLVKPARQMELVARVEAVARRLAIQQSQDDVLTCGRIRLDIPGRQAFVSGARVALTRKEFDLAVALLRQPGELVSREFLLGAIWGQHTPSDTRTVHTHMNRLKKKLQNGLADDWKIAAVHGVGYRLESRLPAGSPRRDAQYEDR